MAYLAVLLVRFYQLVLSPMKYFILVRPMPVAFTRPVLNMLLRPIAALDSCEAAISRPDVSYGVIHGIQVALI